MTGSERGARSSNAQFSRWPACGLVLVFVFASTASAGARPMELPLQQALSAMECLYRSGGVRSLVPPYQVSGIQHARGTVVIASDLVFEPEASLVFPHDSSYGRKSECSGIYYVVAERITSESDSGGVITWDRPVITDAPFDRGRAPAGANGAAAGETGLTGTKGAPGNSGFDGRHSPAIVLLVEQIDGKLAVDFPGQNGGPGGTGQSGGDGGTGQQGRRAASSLFNCKREAGRGGNGGDGGSGGLGGRGGNGGVGGTVIVITSRSGSNDPAFINAMVGSGKGGEGGLGGAGGRPGMGGPEGSSKFPCRVVKNRGVPGQPGPAGKPGQQGLPGEEGDFFLIELSKGEFKKVRGDVLAR